MNEVKELLNTELSTTSASSPGDPFRMEELYNELGAVQQQAETPDSSAQGSQFISPQQDDHSKLFDT